MYDQIQPDLLVRERHPGVGSPFFPFLANRSLPRPGLRSSAIFEEWDLIRCPGTSVCRTSDTFNRKAAKSRVSDLISSHWRLWKISRRMVAFLSNSSCSCEKADHRWTNKRSYDNKLTNDLRASPDRRPCAWSHSSPSRNHRQFLLAVPVLKASIFSSCILFATIATCRLNFFILVKG